MGLTPSPKLSREELHALADLFVQACGFVLREDLSFVAERRLAVRLEVLGLPDFRAYARYLRHDPKGREELDHAIELVMPHETYFFREPAQLEALEHELFDVLLEKNARSRRLRVWSAGCSTGEEPYTLAMLLVGSARFGGWDLDVLGTDLSTKSLSVARHAEYGPSALRATSSTQLARYFEDAPSGRHRVRKEFRQVVRFGHVNLLDRDSLTALQGHDVICCRNVLIYFDLETRRRVIDSFYDCLAPGGYLLLGHSENLLSLSTRFELVHLEGDLVYRRP